MDRRSVLKSAIAATLGLCGWKRTPESESLQITASTITASTEIYRAQVIDMRDFKSVLYSKGLLTAREVREADEA